MTTAADMLAHYLAAETAILSGQSYQWGERKLTRADLSMVQRGGGVGVSLANFTGHRADNCWGRNA